MGTVSWQGCRWDLALRASLLILCSCLETLIAHWETHLPFNEDAPTPGRTVRVISSALGVQVGLGELFIWHGTWLGLQMLVCWGSIQINLIFFLILLWFHISSWSMICLKLKWTSLVFHHRGFPLEWELVLTSHNYVFLSLECRSDLLGDLGLLFSSPSVLLT